MTLHYLFNFLQGEISVEGKIWTRAGGIDDCQHWCWAILLEEIIDLQVRGAELASSVIPSDWSFLGTHLLEQI